MSDQKRNKVAENDQSFQEKLKKEHLIDGIPDEEVKKEEREQEKGRKSKQDSVTEEDYDEDLRP
ncbi:hypothetical protein SAMN05192559_105255 [Halobacillus karajensis]|uniref:Uncharacterized protein n=1 Tax=Halobacillus karajensis TaxID=195088 RepID=A0A024P5J5_9BACI|nr:hypothetical protein [Halobacillus karajensis]CDQ20483.1 hypothetical protein BN982_02824 [Halobacillus karajensis]CDQ24048.1 hypothetical protein BN983_02313 [Halobacillus karajensis]CDQ27526.1 hypothetical protein BN981_01794 [Halobacillus karajensis]SEH91047.1 hypothetical protein SAMN05192559_105255 [Halobacillus karajensis]